MRINARLEAAVAAPGNYKWHRHCGRMCGCNLDIVDYVKCSPRLGNPKSRVAEYNAVDQSRASASVAHVSVDGNRVAREERVRPRHRVETYRQERFVL